MSKEHASEQIGEELNVFDVPCPGCGKNVFTLPYKLGLTHKIHCPNCDTSNYVHIDKKGGVIMLTENEFKESKCKRCDGKGTCPKCNGTGEMICPACGGKGIYRVNEEGFWWHYGCADCGGSGVTKYAGDIPRVLSRGRGKLTCTECKGNGFCPDCGGRGLIL
ncbi:MAG: hypothetical protein QW385_00645 [Thermoproteota archaeon]